MPHRLLATHATEAFVAFASFLVAAAGNLLLYETDAEAAEAMRWLVLPMIGGAFAAAAAIGFNRSRENVRVVVARGICALVFGTAVPKLFSMMHPWIRDLFLEPLAIFLSGFIIALVVFILSRPFVQRFYERSDRIANEQLDELEERFKRSHRKNFPRLPVIDKLQHDQDHEQK